MRASPYFVRDRWGIFLLRCIDAWLKIFVPQHEPRPIPSIKRILLAQPAHLGDVVIATSVLPLLHQAFPGIEVGFVVGSWAEGLLVGHKYVTRVHVCDHWKLNRAPVSLWRKYFSYLKQKCRVIKEIRACRYEVALDLYPFFANLIPLLYRAKIPVRIGYTTGGYGRYLTHPVKPIGPFSQMHQSLLSVLLPSPEKALPCLEYHLLPSLPATVPSNYWVFHVGAGAPYKQWLLSEWKALFVLVSKKGKKIVFTGQSEEEYKQIEEIIGGDPLGINLCSQLTLSQTATLISGSALVVSVDSMAGHIASAYQIPVVILFTGINPMQEWIPQHSACKGLVHPSPCSSCRRAHGCASMACIRSLTAKQVYQAIEDLVSHESRPIS